jgi:F-type H+-transporting ATPase subunit delta
MRSEKVARKYATALYERAEERKSLDRLSEDFEAARTALDAADDLRRILQSPVVKSEDKRAVLKEIFGGKASEEFVEGIDLLANKERLEVFEAMVDAYRELRDRRAGLVEADVATAADIGEDGLDRLKQRLESTLDKRVRMKSTIDEKLIGGFTARVDDTVVDASIAGKLRALKKRFAASESGEKSQA